MTNHIGFAPVSTLQLSTDRQQVGLMAADVRRDDLCIDHVVSGARSSRPQFDRTLDALDDGDTLVITTLNRLGGSIQNMLAFADALRVHPQSASASPCFSASGALRGIVQTREPSHPHADNRRYVNPIFSAGSP